MPVTEFSVPHLLAAVYLKNHLQIYSRV